MTQEQESPADNPHLDTPPQDEDAKLENEIHLSTDNKRQVTFKFVRVRFLGNPKVFTYRITNEKLHHGDQVVAMTDRGIDIGVVNSFIYEKTFPDDQLPLVHRIIRKVALDDLQKKRELEAKIPEIKEEVWHLIEKYNLNMQLSHICFTQWGKKVVIYYTAPERVDFRELVKDLTRSLHSPIELRQISIIDRAMALGGFSIYGVENYSYLPEGKIHQEKGKSKEENTSEQSQDPKENDPESSFSSNETPDIHNEEQTSH